MTDYANGSVLHWTSNKGRIRKVRTVTAMKLNPEHVVEVLDGLPGEQGTFRVVPSHRMDPVR